RELEQLAADGRVALSRRARRRERDAQVVARPRGEVVPARVRLEAAALAAPALPSVRVDQDVAELARHARVSVVQLAAEDDAGADAAADEHDDEIVHAA